MKIKDTIMQCLHKSTSQAPMAYSTLEDAVFDVRPQTTTDEFATALEKLCDAAHVRAIRGQRSGSWQNLYWPLVAAAPIDQSEEKPVMSEPKNSLLNRLILMHGPIAGAALAEKARATGANIPAKNVPGLLETLVRKGEVIVKKHDGASHYMTANQAADWDENLRIGAQMEADSAAHVMSAPTSTKQSGGEIPVSESDEAMPEADPALLASANRMLSQTVENLESDIRKQRTLLESNRSEIAELKTRNHDLLNDVAAANLIFAQMQETLRVERPEDLPGAFDELIQAMATTRVVQPAPENGALAMAEVDATGGFMEPQYFEPYVDVSGAQQVALNMVNDGHSDRVMIIRVIGETHRPPAVFAPMQVQPVQTLRHAA
jgi:hypothetical protein